LSLGVLTIQIEIPGAKSLKEKRSRLKPFLTRLQREFNISVAEIDHNDAWNSAVIACAMVSNNAKFTRSALQNILNWIETHWPDVTVIDDQIEML
jgi:uncharacterized protein YlxP (DUF503 family)